MMIPLKSKKDIVNQELILDQTKIKALNKNFHYLNQLKIAVKNRVYKKQYHQVLNPENKKINMMTKNTRKIRRNVKLISFKIE